MRAWGQRGSGIVALGGLLAACTAVLDIEDLSTEPAPSSAGRTGAVGGAEQGGSDSGGTQATAGRGGGSSGMSANAGRGGTTTNSGGTANGGQGTAGAETSTGGKLAAGGSAGETAAGDGGVGGEAGTPSVPPGPVQGTVIDYWRHPVPNVVLSIGNTTAMSDAQGRFTFADVSETYDVSLVVSTKVYNTDYTHGWVYQGLTRRDPTLQVYRGVVNHSGSIAMLATGKTFPLLATQKLLAAFGSVDGAWSAELGNASTLYLSANWNGPATTSGTIHALLWTENASGLPESYQAYDSHPVVLDEIGEPGVTFDLGDGSAPAAGQISGSVSTASADQRTNLVYLRMPGNVVLSLANHAPASANFTYTVPNIPNGKLTVAASTGDVFLPFAVAHRNGVAVGDANLDLTIPEPAILSTPATEAANVSSSTNFSWTSSAKTFVWSVELDPEGPTYRGVHVVTASKQARLPSFVAAGFAVPAGKLCTWTVETHGEAASVDALAGPEGFADSFASGDDAGPRDASGSYTESAIRSFTTAP